MPDDYVTGPCPSPDCEHAFVMASDADVTEHVAENHVEFHGDLEIDGVVLEDVRTWDFALSSEAIQRHFADS